MHLALREQKPVAQLDRGRPINELLFRYRYVLLLILGFSLIGAVGYGLTHRPQSLVLAVLPPQPTPLATPSASPAPATVHIVGAVEAPGVYTLPPSALIQDAIQAAGGPTFDAAVELLNLAAPIQNHQQILVPRQSDTAMYGTDGVLKGDAFDRININTASSDQLQTLPGIGPVLAERIIKYREAHGPFATIDELVKIQGIGDATLERIRPLVAIGP